MTDNINQPAHYTAGGIETIDVIEQVLGKYDHRDQVEKYNQRAHLKGNFQQDLEKARWYLNRTIENCEKGLLESGTGTRVDTSNEQPETEYATNLNTESVYEDGDGDFWAYNYAEEKWFYYRMNEGEVIGKSPVGHTKGQMVAFTRDFFTRVENTFAILMAILRYDADEKKEGDEADKKFDTSTVHKDRGGDYWLFNESTQEWKWYTLTEDLSAVECLGGTYTAEEFGRYFDTHFIKPVVLMRTERMVREAVEKFDNPEPKIVLGETDPADMPVGTVVYRDGMRIMYSARKEVDGWSLSHHPFFLYADGIAGNWFKQEEGWTLEKPSDVYKDEDGDFWVHTNEGWRWHTINNGELIYTSIRAQKLEDIKEEHSLEKLSDDDAFRVRRIIQAGEV